MTDAVPARDPTPPGEAPRRKLQPVWVGLGFLVLLGLLAVINHRVSTSGPPVHWIENDLPAALAEAAKTTPPRKVFLYLYEANDPVHARNEREVFTQAWARETLAKLVCCRVALTPGDLLRVQYHYGATPMFLLLDPSGKVRSQVDGSAVDERQFYAYVKGPAERAD